MNRELLGNLLELINPDWTVEQPRARASTLRPFNVTRPREPLIDTIIDNTAVYIFVELAGVRKEDLKIDVFNNKLTVSAEKTRSYTEQPATCELYYGHLERVITLPFCVTKPETVTSAYKDGILKIKIDRTVEEMNRFTVQPE